MSIAHIWARIFFLHQWQKSCLPTSLLVFPTHHMDPFNLYQTCQVSRITRESHGFWQFLKAHGRGRQCSRIFVNLTECCDSGNKKNLHADYTVSCNSWPVTGLRDRAGPNSSHSLIVCWRLDSYQQTAAMPLFKDHWAVAAGDCKVTPANQIHFHTFPFSVNVECCVLLGCYAE